METLCTLDFDSSEIQYIDQDIINKIKDKSITHNIFRQQSDDALKCGFYCIAYIDYIIEKLYTDLFSPNEHQKNDEINTLKTSIAKQNLSFDFKHKCKNR